MSEPTLAWLAVEKPDGSIIWYEGAVSPEGAMFKDKPEATKGDKIFAFSREEGDPMPTEEERASMLVYARTMAESASPN